MTPPTIPYTLYKTGAHTIPRPKKKRSYLPATDTTLDDRWEKALGFLANGQHPAQAMIHAGFAESYAYAGGPTKLKAMLLKRTQELLDGYKGQSLANLVPIAEAERQMVGHLAKEGNSQELPTFAAIVKQIKQSAGALAQEVEGARPVLVQVALNIQQHFSKDLEEEPITVQVKE